jgi:hypothetical protein
MKPRKIDKREEIEREETWIKEQINKQTYG